VRLTTYVSLAPRSRTNGIVPPLPCMPSWRGQGQLNFQLWWSLTYLMKGVHLLLLLLLLLLLFCSHPRPGLLSGLLSLGSSTKVVYALLNFPTHATRTTHRPCFARTETFSRLPELSRYRCKVLYSTLLALKPHKLPRLFSISD